jgi:hypothetical protein
LVTFLCRSKKSDSRNARNALASKQEQRAKAKIKSKDQEHPSSILPCAARKGGGRSRSQIKMDPSLTSCAVENRWDDDCFFQGLRVIRWLTNHPLLKNTSSFRWGEDIRYLMSMQKRYPASAEAAVGKA